MKKRTFFSVLLLTLTLIAGVAVLKNKQVLKDNYIARTATLQPQSAALLPMLSLTDQGDRYFRASQPEVQGAQQFNESCKSAAREQSIVLGCYTAQRFFVFDVTDPRLNGVKEVTAAHELLHAVYERLSNKEKESLNTELRTVAASIDDPRFNTTLEHYKTAEPGQVENELHSILGTEIEVLPAPLEAHYKKYFKDRAKIVAFAKQYEKTFSDLEAQINDFDQRLAAMKQQKMTLESSLASQQIKIESERARLDVLRNSDEVDQYNGAVPGFNQKIQQYNSDVQALKQLIAQYNTLVEQRNTLAATQNELAQHLDSEYQPIQ